MSINDVPFECFMPPIVWPIPGHHGITFKEEKMGEEKAVKPKQTGMALEMDVIKKITHQLERAPRGAEMRILAFVQDWAGRRALVPMSPAPNGQLPLAAKDDGFPE